MNPGKTILLLLVIALGLFLGFVFVQFALFLQAYNAL
jgi:hypothetical protein